MTKEMGELIDKYWDEDQHDKIVELIMAVPEEERDIDMLGQLVVAYNNLERYDDAIALSMELKAESTDNPAWYYRIGYAFIGKQDYEKAADNLEIGIALAKEIGDHNIVNKCQALYNECIPHLPKSRKGKVNEPLEIVWSKKAEEYIVKKGAIDLGYLGRFYCHQIEVAFNEYDFKKLFLDKNIQRGEISLKEYLREDMNHDEIAVGLTKFFNQRIQEMTKHIVEINQAFLAYLLVDMCDCAYPFWEECASYVYKDKLPSCAPEEMENVIYATEICNEVYNLFDIYYEAALNGDVDNTPKVEMFIQQNFPMFDYKKVLKDVYAEYLVLGDSGITVQCMGEEEAGKLVCAACVEIRNDISFYDWRNH